MKASIIPLIITLSLLIIGGSSPFDQLSSATIETPFQETEAAYRANNIGVALLEQYKAREAVDSFQRALAIKPDLPLARINLAIALYYLPDAEAAKREAEKALTLKPDAPQPHYILGLIARAQNRFDDARAAFQEVLQIDPDDVGANVNVGQIFAQQRKLPEAIAAFRRATTAEPYNETALYNLGLLLTRSGGRAEGQQLLQKFQQLKQSGAGTSIGNTYLEGGRYAEAVVSTGIEAELVDRRIPDVRFVDATEEFLPSQRQNSNRQQADPPVSPFSLMRQSQFTPNTRDQLVRALASSVTLFDVDGDGLTDILDVGGRAPRLYRNTGSRFVDQSAACGALCGRQDGIIVGAVAGDLDNDQKPDLLLLRYGPQTLSLYHNEGNWNFSEATKQARMPAFPYLTLSAAFADVDHDGDLDIFVAGLVDLSRSPQVRTDLGETKGFISFPISFTGAPNLLLRNNGNGSFSDITGPAGVRGTLGRAMAVVPTDFDNRRDIDLLVVNFGAPPILYSNRRDGTFRDVARETGLATVGARGLRTGEWGFIGATAGDFNKDGVTDFFFLDGMASGVFATSDANRKFELADKTAWMFSVGFSPNTATQFIDYDNDGLLDLVRLMGNGMHVWRNIGNEWSKIGVTEQGQLANYASPLFPANVWGSHGFGAADLDADGDVDLVLRGWDESLIVAKNQGGDRNHSTRINLRGRVSNRSAVGSKVELRAGSLYQKLETYSAAPAPAPADLIFGLGKRERPDAIRVLWPAGIVQAETEFPASSSTSFKLDISELDRKPSSCPYLYAWNGKRFEFVTDFMGGGEMGYLEAPGHYNKPDADEYVRITTDQLKTKNGRYELRVTNELEEALFVDRLRLLAVAHPMGTEVYPNEGMTAAPKPFKLFVTKDARPPISAIDDRGHDVLDLVSQIDRRWPDDFKVDRIRGYAEEHVLTLNLAGPKVQTSESTVLLLTGWTDYAWSSDNLAATQAGKAMKPPSLQVRDRVGAWRTVIEDIGIPVGRPQTVTVDLTGKFLSDKREVRIVTNMRIYWDQILVSESDETLLGKIVKLDPIGADLRWRGFSDEVTPDGREPFGYDYQRVSFISPWKVMTGRYTREGDVRELLLNTDDMFVICRTGDEISVSFDATRLPRLPAGWTRTFLLYSDGFSKEMDINSASPDQVGPLPFHGMSRYPYKWPERYPLTEARRNYLEKYNTRVVTAPVLSIESLLLDR